ncbi:MAG: hypothetical protein Q9216_004068 [Gyalolechia sp. 2 TL-2023]
MTGLPSALNRLYSWLSGEPVVRETSHQVLRIPADGSPPHLLRLKTIETDDNVDCFMVHIPDFRLYWGKEEGFQYRDIAFLEVIDHSQPELVGKYFAWKSFAMDLMPKSKHTGFYGDAFIAKTPLWENDENGAVYEDIPVAFLASPLLDKVLKELHAR